MRHPFRLVIPAIVAALAILCRPAPAGAQPGPQGPIRPEVARGGFLATADGPAVTLSLPAALSFADATRLILGAEMVDDQFGGGLVLWQPRKFAIGYRHVDRRIDSSERYNEDLYYFAWSNNEGPRVAGMEVAWLRNDVPGAADALSFGFSAGARPSNGLWVAYRLENLNRPHYLRDRLERVNAIGLAIRPLGPRIAFATDVLFRKDGSDDFAIRYGVELEPVDGVYLAGRVDNERGFGLAIDFRGGEDQLGYGIRGSQDGGPRHHFIHLGHEDRPLRRR